MHLNSNGSYLEVGKARVLRIPKAEFLRLIARNNPTLEEFAQQKIIFLRQRVKLLSDKTKNRPMTQL